MSVEQIFEQINSMLSTGQFGALAIVVLCVYLACKIAGTAIRVIASVVALLAVVYLIDPGIYTQVVSAAVNGFNQLCFWAQNAAA